MDAFTRRQLLAVSAAFYRAQGEAFDESRGHRPWPGWRRVVERLPQPPTGASPAEAPLRVLDVGCGNARLAAFLFEVLTESPIARPLAYVGVDADPGLLAAAARRLPAEQVTSVTLIRQDFLTSEPGDVLPPGPFDLVALFGVLHHVPGRDWREALLDAASRRLAAGGVLALTAWQFADRPRFARRAQAWSTLPPVLDAPIDPVRLEPGDRLLRFGSDPDAPPRYCHQLSDAELDALPAHLGLAVVDDFRSDGGEADLNRYLVLQRR